MGGIGVGVLVGVGGIGVGMLVGPSQLPRTQNAQLMRQSPAPKQLPQPGAGVEVGGIGVGVLVGVGGIGVEVGMGVLVGGIGVEVGMGVEVGIGVLVGIGVGQAPQSEGQLIQFSPAPQTPSPQPITR